MDRCEVIALIDSLALLLAEGLDAYDQSTLGSLFSAVGDTISTIASLTPVSDRAAK